MSNREVTIEPKPVFLYFDPHPVHEKMANHIGAEMVECHTGGAVDRLTAGMSHSFGDRPVLLEGGVPLLEGAATKLFGESGPIISLGADSTYDDLVDPLPSRSRKSRIAHRVSQRFVDGTLAVSERIATLADRFTDGPVRITHPFIEGERYRRLRDLERGSSSNRILCLGKYRSKNGQDLLREAITKIELDVRLDFVGPDTEQIAGGERVKTHGFVSEERLYELMENASLMVFPAPVGAFPVATLEGLCAGLPVVATPRVGTATLIRGLDGKLVADPNPDDLARAIGWYFDLQEAKRERLSARAKRLGTGFRESEGLEAFGFEFVRLLQDLDYEGVIHD